VTPVANTLAYYDTEKITAVKGFLIWAPVANIINFFTVIFTPLAAYFSMILTELRQ
jgi:hypothetical protein